MQIKVRNVAKVLEADVALDGLTVIAGYNNMGKSTILKVMYIVLNTLRNANRKVITVRKRSISNYLLDQEAHFDKNGYEWLPRELLGTVARKVNDHCGDFMNESRENYTLFKEIFVDSLEQYREFWQDDLEKRDIYTDEFIRPLYKKVREICTRDKKNDLKYVAEMYIRSVFNGQINSLHNESDALVAIDSINEHYYMSIRENKVLEMEYSANTEPDVFYLPAYNLLDMVDRRTYGAGMYSPEYDVKSALYSQEKEPTFEEYEEIESNTKLIRDIFHEVIHGKLERQQSGNLTFRDEDLNDSVRIGNVASGMKTFLIIQSLVEKGKLKRNSILLIDEPETNLHPEWHLKFAEILVLMYKYMGVRSIVNSHSPYFIRAIEVKMADYEVKNAGRYYIMEETGKNFFKVKDVTEKTDQIYELLYKPLQYL